MAQFWVRFRYRSTPAVLLSLRTIASTSQFSFPGPSLESSCAVGESSRRRHVGSLHRMGGMIQSPIYEHFGGLGGFGGSAGLKWEDYLSLCLLRDSSSPFEKPGGFVYRRLWQRCSCLNTFCNVGNNNYLISFSTKYRFGSFSKKK